jgi:hypothetical protein
MLLFCVKKHKNYHHGVQKMAKFIIFICFLNLSLFAETKPISDICPDISDSIKPTKIKIYAETHGTEISKANTEKFTKQACNKEIFLGVELINKASYISYKENFGDDCNMDYIFGFDTDKALVGMTALLYFNYLYQAFGSDVSATILSSFLIDIKFNRYLNLAWKNSLPELFEYASDSDTLRVLIREISDIISGNPETGFFNIAEQKGEYFVLSYGQLYLIALINKFSVIYANNLAEKNIINKKLAEYFESSIYGIGENIDYKNAKVEISLLTLRNKNNAENIHKRYCESVIKGKDLIIQTGTNHLPGLLLHLQKQFNNSGVTIDYDLKGIESIENNISRTRSLKELAITNNDEELAYELDTIINFYTKELPPAKSSGCGCSSVGSRDISIWDSASEILGF